MSHVIDRDEQIVIGEPPAVRATTASSLRPRNGARGRVDRCRDHVVIVPASGYGVHMIDFETYEVRPGFALHLAPGQVHRFDPDAAFEANVVTIRPDLVPAGLFRSARPTPLVPLGDARLIVEAVAADLLRERARAQPSEPVMRASSSLLLHHLARATGGRTGAAPSSHAQLLDEFLAEVDGSFTDSRTVSAYARSIGTSTKTLARATTGLTGLAPKEIIDQRVVLEAKRLLASDSRPIAGIGQLLGFTEATNFTKFFVRLTGQTPHEFRS